MSPKMVGFENRDRLLELGLAISMLRRARGMSQKELAERAGISRSHLSATEAPNAVCSFSLEVLFQLADALDVAPGDLLRPEYFRIPRALHP